MIKKIHHLDCGSFCPHLGQQLFGVDHFCCHCLLIETDQRLILVDTGLSELYLQQNSDFFRKFINNPDFKPQQSALMQVCKLGYKADDVTDIIATHVDQDHVGGIPDFKKARIHMHYKEKNYLDPNYVDKMKRFSRVYFQNGNEIVTYDDFGQDWNGFQSVRMFEGIDDEIFLVPLVGHSAGHSGVVIKQGQQWLFHAGDAYFIQEDLSPNILDKNMKSEIFQSVLAEHNKHRLENQKKLSELLQQNSNVRLINSHDPRYLISNS